MRAHRSSSSTRHAPGHIESALHSQHHDRSVGFKSNLRRLATGGAMLWRRVQKLADRLAALSYTTPTAVQQAALPHLLAGKDLLMRAPTGTGKTLAYLAPIVDTLAAQTPRVSRGEGCHALVITPTRELTLQVRRVGCARSQLRHRLCRVLLFSWQHVYNAQHNMGLLQSNMAASYNVRNAHRFASEQTRSSEHSAKQASAARAQRGVAAGARRGGAARAANHLARARHPRRRREPAPREAAPAKRRDNPCGHPWPPLGSPAEHSSLCDIESCVARA